MSFKFGFVAAMMALVMAVCTVPAPVRAEGDDVFKMPDVCEISGMVTQIQNIVRSPYSDGAPSMLAVKEVHVSVLITDRTPHDKNSPAETCHNDTAKGKKITYKLCSPATVQAGDRIHATEGMTMADPYGVSCLFDVVVMPPAG